MANLSVAEARTKIYKSFKQNKISFAAYDGFNGLIDSYSVLDNGTKIDNFSQVLQSIYDLVKNSIKTKDKSSDNYFFDLIYSITQYITTCTRDLHYIQEFAGKDICDPLNDLKEIKFDKLFKNLLESDNNREIRWRISQLCTISRYLNIVYANKYTELKGNIRKNIMALDNRLCDLMKDKNVM